jgi:valyl-tRNA synthetase
VMAEDGAKMSKSLGNVINPIEVIDQYGSDALRMGIIAGRVPAVNRGYDHRKVEEARNFCNKLWNIARFIEGILGDDFKPEKASPEASADHWILSRLQQIQSGVDADVRDYRLAEAYEKLYHFVWGDVADWYIEASKTAPNKPLLAHVLESVLLLLHPFAPFVTETIWQTLAWEADSLLATRQLPKPLAYDDKRAGEFAELQKIISEVRFVIRSLGVRDVTLYHRGEAFLSDNADNLKRLAGLAAVKEVEDGTGLHLTDTRLDCWLDIDSGAAAAYADKLTVKHEEQLKLVAQLEARLANKKYVESAPKQLVEQSREQLAAAQAQAEKLAAEQNRFRV